jgi:iron complex transport system substrate-binding protein
MSMISGKGAIIRGWALALSMLVVLPADGAKAETLTVHDKFDRTVTVEVPVKRAVLFDTYELAATLGVWDRVSGLSRFAFANDLVMATVPDAKTRFADVGTPVDVNVEALMALKPDLVVTWDLNRAVVDYLSDKGLTVIALHPESFEDVMTALALEGRLFGAEAAAGRAEKEARKLMDFVRDRVATVSSSERRRALWLVSRQNMVAGRSDVMSELLRTAGITNVADEIQQRTSEVPLERILSWNPDLLFVWGYSHADVGEILGDPQWQQLTAVRNGAVRRGPRWSTASPRVAPMTLWLAATAYPQAFADVDVIARTDAFMQALYGVPYDRMNPLPQVGKSLAEGQKQ